MQALTVLKKVAVWGLAGFGVLCLILLLLCQWLSNPSLKHQIQSALGAECSLENTNHTDDVEILNKIEQIAEVGRKMIREDMAGYRYPNGNYNISASKLEDLLIEENGQPIRSMIMTTWRSGSTFLDEILRSHPGNFGQFVPFTDYGQIRVRDEKLGAKAIRRIRALMTCDYSELQDFLETVKALPFIASNTTRLWDLCGSDNSVCFDHRFFSALCKLYPFQSMKHTRIRLQIVEELLADEKIPVRLVLLVRDPRATMHSRRHVEFCQTGPDCTEAALLCADLVADYKTAVELRRKYPNTFRVIRYEDLTADPYHQVEELSKFFGRDFHPNVKRFLDTHTKTKSGGPFSTFRNTKTTPYHWKMEMEFEDVEELQETCAAAMKYWGYLPAINATHLRDFNPIGHYDL